MLKNLLTLALFLILTPTFASNIHPLPVDEAFALTAKTAPDNTLIFKFNMPEGYYLYKDRFHLTINKPKSAKKGRVLMPRGEAKQDEILGKYRVYYKEVRIPVPISKADPQNTVVQICYQGCSKAGYCYPPTSQIAMVNFAANTVKLAPVEPLPEQAKIEKLLESHHIAFILLAFLGFGLLLTFTPCVLPMIPILSGILLGSKPKPTPAKAFVLSLMYVLAMASTYAAAGVAVGHIGGSIQALLQQPWILMLFSALFIALALSLFGLYELKLPSALETKLTNTSQKLPGGSYIGVALMGVLATLIVSPCVTPPLIGVLAYIGTTGNATLGGLALFSLGIGMGIPLIIIGTLGAKLLPKAGAWMDAVKTFLGILLLGVAIWLLSRIIPGPVTLLLCSALFIVTSALMGVFNGKPRNIWQKVFRGFGFVVFLYGVLLLIGASLGNSDPLQPLRNLTHHAEKPIFQRVNSLKDVQKQVLSQQKTNKITVLDFYADWCVACQIMEKKVFQNADVKKLLTQFNPIRVDLTKLDPNNRKLLRTFHVIAPPAIVFLKADGTELTNYRIVGEADADKFVAHLKKLLG